MDAAGAPSVPLDTSAGPRPRQHRVRTHGRVSRAPPFWTSPDVTGRQTHSAGVKPAPDVAKLISCFYWWLLVPPLDYFRFFPRATVFLSMIGQQAVPIVTDTTVALGGGEVALRLEPLLLFRGLGSRPLVTPGPQDPRPSAGLHGHPRTSCTHVRAITRQHTVF